MKLNVLKDIGCYRIFGQVENSVIRVKKNRVFVNAPENAGSDSRFVRFYIPFELPVGTHVTVTAKFLAKSGTDARLSIDSFRDWKVSENKIIEDYEATSRLNDWQSLKAECIIRPGQKYITVALGYWSGGAKWGEFEAKDISIELNGLAMSEVFPQLFSSASQCCQYNPATGKATLDILNDEGGVVAFNSDRINITTPSSSVRAFVATRRYAVKDGVVILRTRSKLISGDNAIATIDFFDSNGAIGNARHFNINTDNEDHLMVIHAPSDAVSVRAVVGYHGGAEHNGGEVEIYDFKLEVYSSDVSSALEAYPVCATLRKEPDSTWIVDTRFVALNVVNATVDGNSLKVAITGVAPERATIQAKIDADGSGKNYFAATHHSRDSETIVEFYARDNPSVAVDPNSLPANTYFTLVGYA
ncbi:TPA: hypothetical protein O4G41_003767 [Vibrio alginolyticus]|nr:hypothetical protein [Vibrio alginolyticus]HCZ9301986.1 hypothetical protein [Vibrio alginolyticus]